MLAAGFDVSVTRVGVGLARFRVDSTGCVVLDGMSCAAQTVNLSTTEWKHGRILQLAQEMLLRAELGDRPDVVFVEKPALPRKSGTDAAFNAGRALQCVRCAVQILGWPDPELLQPAQWKADSGVAARKGATYQQLRELVSPDPVPALAHAKPDVYLRAVDLGFHPQGSQDAADAALVAVAGGVITIRRQKENTR